MSRRCRHENVCQTADVLSSMLHRAQGQRRASADSSDAGRFVIRRSARHRPHRQRHPARVGVNGGWCRCRGPASRWVFVAATVCGWYARVMAQAAPSFATSSPRSAKYVVATCRCSGARLCVCAGEGGGDEATQYGPVALEVAVTILDTAHHHLCEVAQPQVDVRPGQPARQFIVSDGGV
jgi:hypothetical protein